MGIRIKGTGRYVPDRILTNADLEKMVETSDEWITSRTGIKERHIATPEQTTSDMGAEAGKRALEMAGISPEDIDIIIVSTVTPDRPFPNTASIIQRKIGAKPCVCFDIEAACSGLLYSLNTAYSMLASPIGYRRALVIGAEKVSSIVDWSDRSTCVLFGDAASAVVLERDDSPDSYDFYVAGKVMADGKYADILQIPAGGSEMPPSHETVDGKQHYIKMGGPKTFQMAVTLMTNTCRELIEKTGTDPQTIRWAIPHQANLRIIKAVAERMNMTDKLYVNVNRYGNTSSASIGLCLDELNRSGQLQPGDLVLTASFGAGLTWAAMLMRW